jgi:hypothetical protein
MHIEKFFSNARKSTFRKIRKATKNVVFKEKSKHGCELCSIPFLILGPQ